MLRIVLFLVCFAGAWGTTRADTYTFSAPPVLDSGESRSLYGPLADLLSRSTGDTFNFVYPEDWFSYQSDMQHDRFDLLLDDAHFAGWRIAARGHVPLVRIGKSVRYVVIATRAGRIYSKEDLIARNLCAYPQPDLGTITVMQKFKSPFQVPRIVETHAPLARVQRLLSGECDGAVLARHLYLGSKAIRLVAAQLKIVTQTDPYPGLTLTAGRRVPDKLRRAIRRVLLSRKGGYATRPLRDRLAGGAEFVGARAEEYKGLDALLRDYPGFGK